MKKSFWLGKRVLVTGGTGFLGTHLCNQLKKLPLKELRAPSSKEADFREKTDCTKWTKDTDIVIHLAANVGGIGYNQEFPGTLFYDNLLMGVYLMEEARKNKVAKFVGIGTICEYPKFAPIPFKEEDLWNGYPEETNAPYGLAKKMLIVQGQAYRKQYGFDAINLLPVNMYGPGDNFDPKSSHVIPALIRKFMEAKKANKKEVIVWGDGSATREFLYVEDCARAIILATEKYNGDEPVNIGSSHEISIKELAELISKTVGYQGRIVWDTTKPNGQPRRKLDVSKAQKYFGFKSQIEFSDGLHQATQWYLNQILVSE